VRILDLGYRRIGRPLLFRRGAEEVHETTLRVITALGCHRGARTAAGALLGRGRQPVTVAGIRFAGLVGLAAGMDKNGVGVRSWAAMGFGHAELGTVTARPQPGNARPRLFRLPHSQAIINRMGFNNAGAQALSDRLEQVGVRRGNHAVGLPLGISIGKSKVTPLAEATADYLASLRLLAPYADYIAINVSSPNTPGLRSLQDGDALRELVVAMVTTSRTLAETGGKLAVSGPETRSLPPVWRKPVPVFVKIAPDLTEAVLDEVLAVCTDAGVSGLIATNTTLSRGGVQPADRHRAVEAGGLSGAPLTIRAREVVRYLTAHTDLPVIGVGGIMTRDDGLAMLDAGACLLQVYTGYVYGGPGLVADLNRLSGRDDQLEEDRLGEDRLGEDQVEEGQVEEGQP